MSEGFSLNVLAAVVGIITALTSAIYDLARRKNNEKNTREKIDHLSDILKKAGSEIEELEVEVNAKSQRLKELSEHSERLEKLLSLRQEQVEAVQEEIRTTLKENSRSNRLWTILIGAMWFVLGLIVRGFLHF